MIHAKGWLNGGKPIPFNDRFSDSFIPLFNIPWSECDKNVAVQDKRKTGGYLHAIII